MLNINPVTRADIDNHRLCQTEGLLVDAGRALFFQTTRDRRLLAEGTRDGVTAYAVGLAERKGLALQVM